MNEQRVRWYLKLCVSAIHMGVKRSSDGSEDAVICLVYDNPCDQQLALRVAQETDKCQIAPSVCHMRLDGEQISTTKGVPYVIVMFEVRSPPSGFMRDIKVLHHLFGVVAEQSETSLIMTAEADFPDGLPDIFFEEMSRRGGYYLEIATPIQAITGVVLRQYTTEWSRWLTILSDSQNFA